MAAGTGAASGHSSGRGSSSAALQSSLDRRFQGVSNTMESIQGLSNWCIENKKYHNFIARYWVKWLKKSGASQMLNLFYVANDVIQNCKRKNAIIYRSSFAEVLPEAALVVKDPKVRNSVERILTIWEERTVYPKELIAEIRAGLAKKSPPSGQSSGEQAQPPRRAPPNPKAALKSKILAEFAPPAFIEKLSQHKRSLEEAELKEKQLAALRVDVCSTEALKRLKDKAGGKKFSKDFEEGSTKLHDFVSFLEQQLKGGPPLLEALGNADVFYEMQYKEVKIIANAYKTFANRVTHLKRKLDALKSTLPGMEDSPVPSPSEDAPSPTGSESPFHGMDEAVPDADLDGLAMDDGDEAGVALGDVPSPLSSLGGSSPLAGAQLGEKDNRDVEDMELSEGEETTSAGIIVEEQVVQAAPVPEPKPAPVPAIPAPQQAPEAKPVKEAPPPAVPAATPLSPVTTATAAPTLPVNLANVDLGKISSILSSLTSAMKNSGVSPVSRVSPGTPGTPSGHGSSLKTPPPAAAGAPGGAAPSPNPLASILSRVPPESLLSALSKTQGAALPGISLLQSMVGGSSGPGVAQQPSPSAPPHGHASGPPEASPAPQATPEARAPALPLAPDPKSPSGGGYEPEPESKGATEQESAPPVASFPSSLESKIHKFLQGNPGFKAFNLGLVSGDGQGGSSGSSPFLATENLDGTPVRDEAPGTPTQDEMMDKPVANAGAPSQNGTAEAGNAAPPAGLGPGEFGRRGDGRGLSPTAYRGESWGPPEGLLNSQGYRHPDPTGGPRGGASRDGRGADEFYGGGDRRGVTAGEHYPLRPPAGQAGPPGGSGGGEGGSEPDAAKHRPPHYQHIQTLVSPSACGEGPPSLGYSGRRPSGERIQTVESIRVIGQGVRQHPAGGGEPGGRPGWYGEAYAEGGAPHPRNPGSAPHRRPDDPHGAFPFEERGRAPPFEERGRAPPFEERGRAPPFEERGRGPYPGRDPHPPQGPRIPPSDFFSSPPPPIPPPPPPPIPQLPPPPKDFLAPPTSVMVGGVLVPVERPLPQPPSRGGEGEERSGSANPATPPGHFRDLPHHGTVKDHFPSRQAPPLHRPPSSMLGRVREGHSPPPSGSPPHQPHGHRQPPSPNLRPPHPHPNHRPQHRPQHQHQQPRPHPHPFSQRPPLRGHHPRPPQPHFGQEPGFRGGKRPGPHFGGPPRGGFAGGPFFPPKRPYLPPRY